MQKKLPFFSLFLAVFLLGTVGICCADTPLIDNGDGTFSMENGIYLRQYDGYSVDSQQFLSVLDACYSMIGSYSEIIDPYINGEKSFDDDQWNVINSEVRYMSGYACADFWTDWRPASIRRDLDQIQGMGLNGVRMPILFEVFEPEEGKINSVMLDRLGEFLDWADAAPKDALIYQGCVREQIIEYGDPLVRDFSGFYDTKTAECSFDSPLFRRYLDWLASLPDEKALIAIRGEMSVVQFFLRQGFESGKLLLTDESLGGARSLGSFALAENQGTAFLDAPTSGGAGMEIRVGSAYLIPACAASPDLAWQYIRAALISADSDPTNSLTPALKSAFSETLASYRGGRIAEGSDGSVYPLREGEDVGAGLKRTTTFRYSDLSDETIAETLAFFDRAAAPILEMTPDTVTSILTEEISACLSGVGTSEDCAAKIQSRVSIWLAENK